MLMFRVKSDDEVSGIIDEIEKTLQRLVSAYVVGHQSESIVSLEAMVKCHEEMIKAGFFSNYRSFFSGESKEEEEQKNDSDS